MGVDCVFWIRLPEDDKEGKRVTEQFQKDVQEGKYLGAYASFESMPKKIQELYFSMKEYDKEQEERYFKSKDSLPSEEQVLEYRKAIDSFYLDDEKTVVKEVRGSLVCRYPIFAYSRLYVEKGYVTIHDGCRRHLNEYFQAEMLDYLEKLVPDAQGAAFVLGDNQWINDDHTVSG